MPGFEYGLKRVIIEIVGGFVTSTILIAFINSGLLDASNILLFSLLNLAGTISLILAMPF